MEDRELVSRAFTTPGLACNFTYATNEEQFSRALEQTECDLILSDFSLPGYSGAAALTLAKAKRPDIPYLFVSGTIGEERAVESLRNGATDYVLKNRMERLLPAVLRALSEAAERIRRHAAEYALRQSEERFREMAETIRDVFWSAPGDGDRFSYLSPACEQIWGRPASELIASPRLWLEVIAPQDRASVEAALANLAAGKEYRIEFRIHRPDDSVRWIEDRGYPVRGVDGRIERRVGVATDITERRLLEAQLRQAQKMEAIGQLAGGIAHDFNNILTVIMGNASLLLDTNEFSPECASRLRQIYTAGERAAGLTRQLLVFSRKQAMLLQPIDLNELIDEAVKLLGRLIGEHIRLEFRPATPLPPIEADAGMIEQVLMNLAVNARDAMPRGGQLVIQTESVTFDAPDASTHPAGRSGTFVCIRVADTGCGIPPEARAHIFEPFFTTKEFGKGTGMGLATVFGIVQQHQGWVTVGSTVGAGTAFSIFLPAAAAGVVPVTRAVTESTVNGGSETILLVEDEAPVREFATAVLHKLGYRVLQASSSVQALDTWRWHSQRIALLLTDMVMPDELSGFELAEKLKAEKPSLKVICVSGYSPEMLEQFSTLPAGFRFIHKPYQPRVLAKAVREVLDGGPREFRPTTRPSGDRPGQKSTQS